MGQVFPIKPEDVHKVWDRVTGYLTEAMEYGLKTHNLGDILDEIMRKHFVLWIILDNQNEVCGAAVTGVEEYPQMRICSLRWLAGRDINDWQEYGLSVLADWAKLNKCDYVRVIGRQGWIRQIKNSIPAGHVCLLPI